MAKKKTREDRIVRDWKGELFVATGNANWQTRLKAWQEAYRKDGRNCTVPCPMPEQHVMFTSKHSKADYSPINFTY